jgi:hypothetical protein
MLCPFDFFSGFLRKMQLAFFAMAFLLIAPSLQAAQETNGQPAVRETILTNLAVLSKSAGRGATFVLELPTAAKSRAETTVGVEST